MNCFGSNQGIILLPRKDRKIMELRKTSPKQMQLINDDYLGRVEKLRHACRGILISERNYDMYA